MAGGLSAQELLSQVAKRDTEALSQLYDRFAPRLLGLLDRILRDRHRAGEILVEVFLNLWREARSLNQQEGSVAAWLVMDARLTALQSLSFGHVLETPGSAERRKSLGLRQTSATKSHPARSVHSACRAKMPLAWIPRPEEIARVEDRLVLLQKVVDQMPKPQREALDLCTFNGHTEAQIAQELGEPLAKVRAVLRAAVTFLRHRRRAVVGTWRADI